MNQIENKRSPEEVKRILSYIPAGELGYNDWVSVGMALKNEGYAFELWDDWSIDDEHAHERRGKWDGFPGGRLRMGTIIERARKCGCPESVLKPRHPGACTALDDFGDLVGATGGAAPSVTPNTFKSCRELAPQEQTAAFIEHLFRPGEFVCFESSTQIKTKEPLKYSPAQKSRRIFMERDELIKRLRDGEKFPNHYQPAGMWCCLNPTDGGGRQVGNVTEWRYGLAESDTASLEEQEKFFRSSGLPIMALYTSGGHSVHACLNLGASTKGEHKERLQKIHKWCEAQGFPVDEDTSGGNRLSRLPGFMRGDTLQELLCICENPKTYEEWEGEAFPEQGAPDVLEGFVSAADVEEAPTHWVLDGLIPAHCYTIIGGPGGVGKSSIICDLVAGLISGGPTVLEYGRDTPARQPVTVLWLSAEDDIAQQIIPKLKALGCTEEALKRLFLLPNTSPHFSRMKLDSRDLFEAINHYKPSLIVLDPLQSFLPRGVDMARRNDMREALQPLLECIGDRDIAVLLAAHRNKSLNHTGVNSIADSKDLTDIARSVFVVDRHYEGTESYGYISHEKNSYAKRRDTILFRIEGRAAKYGNVGVVSPFSTTEKKDQQFKEEARAKNPRRSAGAVETAKDTIQMILSKGELTREELLNRAQNEGVTKSAFNRALPELQGMGKVRTMDAQPDPDGSTRRGPRKKLFSLTDKADDIPDTASTGE